jgi:hypothetical protein
MSVKVAVEGPEGRQGPRWLAGAIWLALALLLGFAYWLLLNACGLRMLHGSPLLYFCPVPAASGSPLAAEIERQRALEGEIERLELALLRAPQCDRPADGQPADIPEDAWREQDVGFLEGCWELDSDYAITAERTGETVGVADWRACFDRSGRGRQDLTFEDGSACDGPVGAEFAPGDRLVLRDGGDVPCRAGSFISFIYERVITCERVDAARAQCVSVHPATGGESNVNLRRAAPE